MSNKAPGKSIESKFRKPLLGLLIAFSALAAVEMTMQVVYLVKHKKFYWAPRLDLRKSIRFNSYTLIDYPANTRIFMPGYPNVLETDRYGFIHNGQDREIRQEDYTIFVLGGSTIEGRGASSNSRTICAHLEIILSEKFKDKAIRVINAGRTGFNAYQELSLLNSRIIQDFSPDLVVSFNGRNDAYYLMDKMGQGWRPNWQPYYDELNQQVNSLLQRPFLGIFGQLAMGLTDYSTIADGIKSLTKPSVDPNAREDIKLPADIVERGVKSYMISLLQCQSVGMYYGFDYLAVLQPILTPRLKKANSTSEVASLRNFLDIYPRRDYYFTFMQRFYDVASIYAQRYQWFHDMSGIFTDVDATMYYDTCHYNDQANQVIAGKLADFISPIIARHGK